MNYAQDVFNAYERLTGRTESRIVKVGSSSPLPAVHVLFFQDWPHIGVLTAFTLGVGQGLHVPELEAHLECVVSLATQEEVWGLAIGHLAEEARSHTCLSFGSTLSLPNPIALESAMTGFMLTAPHHWPTPPRFRAADRDVALLEAHPLLPSEIVAARHCSRDRIQERLTGPQYDVRRPPLL